MFTGEVTVRIWEEMAKMQWLSVGIGLAVVVKTTGIPWRIRSHNDMWKGVKLVVRVRLELEVRQCVVV